MNSKYLLYTTLLGLILLGACSAQTNKRVQIGTESLSDGSEVALYADYAPLLKGPNMLQLEMPASTWQLQKTSLKREDGMMTAPVGALNDGKIEIMVPDTMRWNLHLVLNKEQSPAEELTFPIEVTEPESWRLDRVRTDSSQYWVGITAPLKPIYGIQPLEVAVYRQKDGQIFEPADSLQLMVQPWMQMGDQSGHSSPFNRDPIRNDSLAPGHYLGQVSYSMEGLWQLRLGLFQIDGTAIDTARFEMHVWKSSD